MSVVHTSTEAFSADVLEKEGPVLVKFWAPWCASCVAMAPGLEAFAEEHEGKISVVKVDMMENTDLITAHGIRSLPNLQLFVDGKSVKTVVGPKSKEKLEELFL